MKSYLFLEEQAKKMSILNDVLGILNWDASTMMPKGASPLRGEQASTLKIMVQEIVNHPSYAKAIQDAESENLSKEQKANLAEIKRLYIHQSAISPQLLKEFTEITNETEMIWRDARAQNNFKALQPNLTKVFDLARQIGEAKAEKLGCTPYEALIDEFDPGSNCQKIDAVFNDLEAFLPPFLEKVLQKQDKEPKPIHLKGPFPIEKQKELGEHVMKALGFDFDHGRLDISTHPFCGGATKDVRITTRYNEDDFSSALYGVIHETGHAIYEQARPDAWLSQPVGNARGMGVHESQSLFYEKQIGRNPHFIRYLTPHLKTIFGREGKEWESDNLIHLNKKVERSFIRVEADEVTYPLHVIMRYKIEKGIIEGKYKTTDLPEIWADYMEKYLGLKPNSDAMGCLQDLHWPCGAIGYFPSYTMGALIAAQLFEALQNEHPAVEHEITKGEFSNIRTWLGKNIHQKASFVSQDTLLQEATKKPLSTDAFKKHLTKRYLDS
jgi:carboxypeptidase Taq